MKALTLLLFCLGVLHAEDSTLPYRLTGMSVGQEREAEIAASIGVFHRYMVSFVNDDAFPVDAVDLTIHIDDEYDVFRAGMAGGWRDKGKKFQGKISLAHPSKYDGKRFSNWGVPFDLNYFRRLVLHEIAPIYLERISISADSGFYSKPSWIVQGTEEYFSFHHGQKPGLDPALRIIHRTSLSSLDYGIILDDPYLDGYILYRFIITQYGETTARKLLTSRGRTTPAILADVTADAPKELLIKLRAFVDGLTRKATAQQGGAPDASGAGDL
jgi:hypothetical protein